MTTPTESRRTATASSIGTLSLTPGVVTTTSGSRRPHTRSTDQDCLVRRHHPLGRLHEDPLGPHPHHRPQPPLPRHRTTTRRTQRTPKNQTNRTLNAGPNCPRCLATSHGGAGGNRTPVHQPVNELATTIPGVATDAVTPTGRLSARGGPRSVFPVSQRSFSPSAVFPAVIPHFCCRAVMDWPRATFLLTMTLHSPENQAARANCSSAILLVPPFSESEELGSQTRTALLTSKPVSPVIDM